MTINDPIGDMISRIRNAIRTKRTSLELPSSKLKAEIAKVLKSEGYISDFEVQTKGHKSTLVMGLKYRRNKENVMNGIKRISTPGRHLYYSATKIPTVQSGFGTSIVSTSSGIMTDKEARKKGVGGEILCKVW